MRTIRIYGKQNCSYCEKTKTYLDALEQEYEYIDITHWDQSRKEELKKMYNITTVPVILINDKFIGGYNDLIQKMYLL